MRLLLPILFLLSSVGIFFAYSNPVYQDIKAKQGEQAGILAANNDAAQLRAIREKLLNQMNNISISDRNRLQEALPDSVENVGLIININNIASQYGMSIKNARINDASGGSGSSAGPNLSKYGAMSLSFNVSTNYNVFLAFLRDLESSLRIVDVTSLTFASSDNGTYDFGITIKTYWLK